MIPAHEFFMSDTSGALSLDYSNSTGSGDTVSYQHKITTSSDLKASYTSTIGDKIDFEKKAISPWRQLQQRE